MKTVQKCTIVNGKLFINGEQIELPKHSLNSGLNITQHNNKLYINGYEQIDGKWRRTLAAIWHYLF